MILVIVSLVKYVFKKPSKDRVEQSIQNTKNLYSKSFDKFKGNISTRQPYETRLIIYDRMKYRAIATALITYPSYQFNMLNKSVLERDFPQISWEFKDYQKHSKYAPEVGKMCLNHICGEGYGGASFHLQTDYTKLMERMNIRQYKLFVNDKSSNPFQYDIPLHNSLDNQAPRLGRKISKFIHRHPEAIQDLEKFVDRKLGKSRFARNSQFNNKKIKRKKLSEKAIAENKLRRVNRLKQDIARACAEDRLFIDALLGELKQSQNQHQKNLIARTRNMIKCPTNRDELKLYLCENKGNEKLIQEVELEIQENKLKQELKQKGKLHELKQPESTIKF